jgi:hypothetical protein
MITITSISRSLTHFNLCFTQSAMPCQPDEGEAQIPDSPNPVTPMKLPRDDGAGYDNSDAEIPLTQSDEEEEENPKQKRKRVVAEYELVKR